MNPGVVYTKLMDFMSRLARFGLIHCDFNEFNVLVRMPTSALPTQLYFLFRADVQGDASCVLSNLDTPAV